MRFTQELRAKLVVALLLVFIGIWYLTTRLSMAPVPWPDGAAYYLPGIELVSAHPQWRMHNQAAFIPTYDEASFNIPPGLPFLLGLTDLAGLNRIWGAQIGLRVVSISGLLLLGWLVFRLSSRKLSPRVSAMLALATVLDPITRWGAMAVRTEIWVAVCGVFLFSELVKKNPSLWKVSLAFALSAIFHYDAIILVPAGIIALFPRESEFSRRTSLLLWWRRLWQVAAITLLLLSPFILYTFLHLPLFISQMGTQFARLSHGNFFIGTRAKYDIFHVMFLDFGNPSGPPKFFNVAKFVLWLAMLMSVALTFVNRKNSRDSLMAFVTFGGAIYLWYTKPEIWFVSLTHFVFWPFIALVLGDLKISGWRKSFTTLATLVGLFMTISLICNQMQSKSILPYYTWNNFEIFEKCIERQIPGSTKNYRVWELGYPDVLVDLAAWNRTLDLTRTLDFPDKIDVALSRSSSFDMLIFNNYSDYPAALGDGVYEGPPRATTDFDSILIHNGRIPYGQPIWDYINRPENSSQWNFKICQGGPFWATLALKK